MKITCRQSIVSSIRESEKFKNLSRLVQHIESSTCEGEAIVVNMIRLVTIGLEQLVIQKLRQ